MEPSRISGGAVQEDGKPRRTKINEPPQEAPVVICGTIHSSDVTVTSLNVPPMGSKLASQADPVWVSVSHTMTKTVKFGGAKYSNYQAQVQEAMENSVGDLMDRAKLELCKEARSVGCNAVLGMTFNISKDSNGECSSSTKISLMMMGTPCVLLHPSFSPTLHPAISALDGSGGIEAAPFGDRCTVIVEPLKRKAARKLSYTGGPPPRLATIVDKAALGGIEDALVGDGSMVLKRGGC